MKKFMVLYQSPVLASERMADAEPEEMQESMEEWIEWRDKAGGEKRVEFGMPLETGRHIEDGEVTEGELEVSGYSIIQADSLDDAVKLLSDHPHLKDPDNSIEVLEFLTMPGM